jgi:hypothetical protein
MSKDILDMKRTPVDRTAAQVLARGEVWEPNKIVLTGDSDLPLPLLPVHRLDAQQKEHFFKLKGLKFGLLTVIGIAAEQGAKGNGLRFVVRCDCGKYTYRRSRSVRNTNNNIDRCEHCRHLLFLKKMEHFRRTGKDADLKEFA